jgi:formylglycine-generating enzyme required for sulfatase activity
VGRREPAHAAVGSYAPNPFGLYDVHGNVWEWCRDGWDENYYGHCPARDPVMEAAGTLARAFRGGSCSHPAAGAPPPIAE